MTEQTKKPMSQYAMQYGVYAGIYILLLFLLSVWNRYSMAANWIFIFLVVASPAALYLMMNDFVRRTGGVCRFAVLWMLGICTFFFASLISGAGEYIYCRYIDADFIPSLLDEAAVILEALAEQSPDNLEIAEMAKAMRTVVDRGLVPSAIEVVFNMMWAKMFFGSLLSAFVSFFMYISCRSGNS